MNDVILNLVYESEWWIISLEIRKNWSDSKILSTEEVRKEDFLKKYKLPTQKDTIENYKISNEEGSLRVFNIHKGYWRLAK